MATRYLLGKGERLTNVIDAPKRGGEKARVYDFPEALAALRPSIEQAIGYFDSLDQALCPDDFVVAKLTLNPAYIAKSYFPSRFLRYARLEAIGSRNDRLTPRKWSKKSPPTETETTTVFVAGQRTAFRQLPSLLGGLDDSAKEGREFAQLEQFAPFVPDEKIKRNEDGAADILEIGLHLLPGTDGEAVIAQFVSFVESLGGEVLLDLQFPVSNLWFVPVKADLEMAGQIAQYTFVRVVRPMPKLRGLRPLVRATGVTLDAQLPTQDALSSEPKVAILDGGLPDQNAAGRWVKRYEVMDPKESATVDGPEHGLGVLSAFLFGPMTVGEAAPRPYANADCFRVLDQGSEREDALELYRTLGFIESVLLSRQYQLVNISLGPDLPIDDNDVHAWTAVIDGVLEDGETLVTIAAGNNGDRDRASGNARVQVPSDCVNAISVGACDVLDSSRWTRASYSALGPGRRPGIVKPDVVTFGGSTDEYFHHLAPGPRPVLAPNLGTSFAAPYLLRTAAGVRAVLGKDISLLGIKALLIHCAQQNGHTDTEVGWGRVPGELADIINCPDGTVRVVYQGKLKPKEYLRAEVPVPDTGIQGNVEIKATFCYACPVDPQDAAAYTCAGLDVVFRPDLNKPGKDSDMPKSRKFFDLGRYASEGERRSDSGKWETVLHGEASLRGSTLKAPAFDVHYNARVGGAADGHASPIPYALVITISAPKHPTIYDDILKAYAELLVPLEPQVTLPVRV